MENGVDVFIFSYSSLLFVSFWRKQSYREMPKSFRSLSLMEKLFLANYFPHLYLWSSCLIVGIMLFLTNATVKQRYPYYSIFLQNKL